MITRIISKISLFAVFLILSQSTMAGKLTAVATSPDDSDKWVAMPFPEFDASGTIMDFSRTLNAPAGKFGPIVIGKDGHLYFRDRPGAKVRFYGCNLCYSAVYIDKKESEKLADSLARAGYNAVRLHHNDGILAKGRKPGTMQLDKKMLDRQDYLIYCLKRKGIYVTSDLYCDRKFIEGEIPGTGRKELNQFKVLSLLSPEAMKNWKDYARLLLTHKNPYTGLALKDDPALISLSLLNEDSVFQLWKKTPIIKAMFLKRYSEWLKAGNHRKSEMSFRQFLCEIKIAANREMTRFLREELKCRTIVSGLNSTQLPDLTLIRNHYDFVDNHSYWNHIKFSGSWGKRPYKFNNHSAVEALGYCPRVLMPTRIFGKPFMVTEFNYCYPSESRGEGGGIIGAYSSLQDWDGLFRFTYANKSDLLKKKLPINLFNIINDPISRLSDKIAMLLFVRKDVAPATNRFPVYFSESEFYREMKKPLKNIATYSYVGLYGQIGACVVKKLPDAANIISVSAPDFKSKIADLKDALKISKNAQEICVTSDTREVSLDCPRQLFKVITPKTELISTIGNVKVAGNLLSVTIDQGDRTICVSAMDDKPLAESRRILLMHLTDVQNSDIKFIDKGKTRMVNWGKLPLMLRKGRADIRLRVASGEHCKVKRLSLNGTPEAEVPAQLKDGVLSFTADTASGSMLYEIICR